MKRVIRLFYFSIVLFLAACQSDVVRPLELGDEYAPSYNIGAWWEYQVDSSYVDDYYNPPLDTTISFRLLEVFSDTMLDNSGRLSFVIDRYKKYYNDTIPYDSMSWQHTDVWYCTPTDLTFERIEENIRYVRLNFPVEDSREWDGNVYNTYNEWNYNYQNLHEPYSVIFGTFDSTIYVEQRNNLNIIDDEFAYEVYAKNVGLIKKVFKDQVLNIASGEPASGPDVTWDLIDYGF